MQLDICSYDQNDLRVKQLSLVIDYFESVPRAKSVLPLLFKRFEPELHLDDSIFIILSSRTKLFVVPIDMKSKMSELAYTQFLSGHQER